MRFKVLPRHGTCHAIGRFDLVRIGAGSLGISFARGIRVAEGDDQVIANSNLLICRRGNLAGIPDLKLQVVGSLGNKNFDDWLRTAANQRFLQSRP